MAKHLVGSLIRRGATSIEIRKQVDTFPDNPDIDYFISLGYSYNTARIYKKALHKNNSISLYKSSSSLIFSKNADVNNILLDTCALKSKEAMEIIKNSNSVTVLYATLKEMDSLRKKQNVSHIFKDKTIKLTKEMLLSDSKYNLVPFQYKSHEYTDEIILQYLMSLLDSERPTLLTADLNFALRAKCLKLDYILYMKSDYEVKKEDLKGNNDSALRVPIGNLGVKFLINDSIIIQKFSPLVKIFIVAGQECKDVSYTRNLEYQKFDYFAIVAKSQKHGTVKVQKIIVENNREERSEIWYNCKDDITLVNANLHPQILKNVSELF